MNGARDGWQEFRVSDDPVADGPPLGVTAYTTDSGRPGPRVLVLGGVHGNEVGGVLGAGSLTAGPVPLRAGRLTVVPVAHEAAFAAGSRTGPADGENLARVFPGDPAGTPTPRLAALLDRQLISAADVLIDLHTSSPDADMPLFAGCLDDGSAVATRAVELAVAFGAGMVWTHPRLAPGRTLSVAHARGAPALYVESPRGGVLDAGYVGVYSSGVRRVLAHLGMLEDAPPGRPLEHWLHAEGDTDSFTAAAADGLFLARVALLDEVARGQVVGQVVGPRGDIRAEVAAVVAGRVATLRTSAVVRAGTPVVGVAPARPASLGHESDAIAAGMRSRLS